MVSLVVYEHSRFDGVSCDASVGNDCINLCKLYPDLPAVADGRSPTRAAFMLSAYVCTP